MALEPCPNCSKRISPEAQQCPRCGHPLSKVVWARARQKRKRNAAVALAAVVVVFGGLAIAGFVWSTGGGETANAAGEADASAASDPAAGTQTASAATDDADPRAAEPVLDAGEGAGGVDTTAQDVAPTRAGEGEAADDTAPGVAADVDPEVAPENPVARDDAEAERDAGTATGETASQPDSRTASQAGPPESQDELVRRIQQALNDAGYEAGPVDGVYGNRTRQGIEAFQRAEGLRVTGEPTRRLLEALE